MGILNFSQHSSQNRKAAISTLFYSTAIHLCRITIGTNKICRTQSEILRHYWWKDVLRTDSFRSLCSKMNSKWATKGLCLVVYTTEAKTASVTRSVFLKKILLYRCLTKYLSVQSDLEFLLQQYVQIFPLPVNLLSPENNH